MKKLTTCFLSFFLIAVPCFSQVQPHKIIVERNPVIDSLSNLLRTLIEDTTKIKILNILSGQYLNIGNYEQALKHAHEAKQKAINLNYQKGISISYGIIGNVYTYQGNYEMALNSYLKCLKIFEATQDKKRMASSYSGIGNVYYYQRNYKKAMDNYLKSLGIFEKIGDEFGMAMLYNNIGFIFEIQGNEEKALESHLKSLKHNKENGNKGEIASSYAGIANIYNKQGDYERALDNFLKHLEISKEIGNKQGVSSAHLNIGIVYMKQNKLEESLHYLLQSLTESMEIGSKETIKDSYSALSDLFSIKGDYKHAYHYNKLYSDIKDTLLNEQSSKQIAEMNTKYDSEKKDKELIKKDAEINKQQAETEKQNLQRNAFIIGFALVLVLAFFIFRSYRQKRNANKLLEEKNIFIENQKQLVENKNEIIEEKQKEIIASITYAKRIQQAILPPDKLVKEFLPDNFILYKPKDIVAGDFYWIEKIDSVILIAAADCTGHGVPGAMVSVVCNNALNRSLREFGLRDPGMLLNKTRELVIEQFEKSEEEVKDGMDISLCVLNTKTNQLNWAGANNPLWVIRNGRLTEIKPDKQPIGKYIETKAFNTHSLQLEKGNTIYLFSDGYADQFGGERGKKIKTSAMKELLLSIQHNTMEEQKELLNQAFDAWKGRLEQVDDVLIIGIKI